MAKCPKCGGELSPQENGLWTCAACGKLFRIKQKTTPESTQGADVPPVNGSGADVPPVQPTPVAPAAPAQEERSQAAEIEELKRRLAEMERRQSEQQPASHSGAAASAAAVSAFKSQHLPACTQSAKRSAPYPWHSSAASWTG